MREIKYSSLSGLWLLCLMRSKIWLFLFLLFVPFHGMASYPLHDSIKEMYLRFNGKHIKELIASGVDLNTQNEAGETPLHIVCNKDSDYLAQLLIDAGADLNVQDNNGQTPLHVACYRLHYTVATILVRAGAHLNKQNKKGETILHIMIRRGKDTKIFRIGFFDETMNMVKTLVHAGVDVGVHNNQGKTAFNYVYGDYSCNSCMRNGVEMLRLLFKPTMLLGKHIVEEIAERLRKKATSRGNSFCEIGYDFCLDTTVLFDRALYLLLLHQIDELEVLLSYNGELVHRKGESYGSTLLMHAATSHREDSVIRLLELGADPTAKTKNGRTVFDFVDQIMHTVPLTLEERASYIKILRLCRRAVHMHYLLPMVEARKYGYCPLPKDVLNYLLPFLVGTMAITNSK